MMSRTVQRYGWHPSLPDPRDLIADTSGIKVLPEVDPRDNMPPPYDQLALGSCTANAIAGAIEYDSILNDQHRGTPSRLDIYYGERKLEGTVASDSGAFGRDGFKYTHTVGWVPEADWPYLTMKFKEAPPLDEVRRRKIGAYAAVPRGLTSFKRVLSNHQTIAFGMSLFESFESAEVARSGIVPLPEPGERMIGGHETLICGYLKSEPHYALVRNSWGNWGLGGYFLCPWSMILDPKLASDFRTIKRPLVSSST